MQEKWNKEDQVKNITALSLSKGIQDAFKKASKVVDLPGGLTLNHFIRLGQGQQNPMKTFQEGILALLKKTAMKEGKQNLIYEINKAHAQKVRIENKNKTRKCTVLQYRHEYEDIRDNMDADKNYFLTEFLKILAYAENYYK